MVQKPPVDIEWYDDGFSMEEQAKLKHDYQKIKAANRPKIQVTEEYHEKTKDKIISDLRQKLAASEEYIKELEETSIDIEKHPVVLSLRHDLAKLQTKHESLKEQYSKLNKQYSDFVSNPENGFKIYRDTIKDLRQTIKNLEDIRNELIAKLQCSH